MAKVTITFDDTNPAIVALFGEGAIATLADDFGYVETVHNPDYIGAIGSPQIPDLSWTPGEGEDESDRPIIDNPDYVPAVGESTIPNPVTRAQYVADVINTQVIVPAMLSKFEVRRKQEKEAEAMAQVAAAKTTLAAAAEITITE